MPMTTSGPADYLQAFFGPDREGGREGGLTRERERERMR